MVCNLYLLQRQPGPKQQFSIENAASLAAKGSRRLALHTWTVPAKPFRPCFRVRPGIGAKRVRRGMRGGGRRYCGPAFLGAQGRHLRESDGTGGTWSGWTFSIGHPSPMSTPGRVGSRGALRGRSPRTREGRIGPTARNCSGQWLGTAVILAETGVGTEGGIVSSRGIRKFPLFWDAPSPISGVLRGEKDIL